MDGSSVASWVAESLAREKRRGEADAGLVGTAGPRDPAGDLVGTDSLTPEAARAAVQQRLAGWA